MYEEWLRKALKNGGLSQAELARKVAARMGRAFDRSKINKAVNGTRALGAEELLIISELTKTPLPQAGNEVYRVDDSVVGLPLVGYVQAGTWTEIQFVGTEGDHDVIPIPRDSRFPEARQYVLGMLGDSMNLQYPDPDNTFISCVDFADSGLTPKSGMIVHVERYRNGGQEVENTLKILDVRAGGELWLMPNSSNPIHKPMHINGDDATEIVIRGVALGSYHKQPI